MALKTWSQSVPWLQRDGFSKVLVEMEFENFEARGKAMDDPKTKEVSNKFASYTHGLKWNLWDISPLIPEPLKPSHRLDYYRKIDELRLFLDVILFRDTIYNRGIKIIIVVRRYERAEYLFT